MKRVYIFAVISCLLCILAIEQRVSAVEWRTTEGFSINDTAPITTFAETREENALPIIPIPDEIEKKQGDADGNGEINYMDALLVLRHSIGLEEICEDVINYCDVDKNNELNYMDALLILRYSIGLIEQF